MVRAVLTQLGIGAHPWRLVPALTPSAEPNVGVSVNDGIVYVPGSTLDEAAAALADQLLAHVIHIEWRAVPDCLACHPHPPNAELVDGHAVWVCPKLGTTVRPILDNTS